MHPGDRVTADRVSSALQRIRKKYLKQNRLLAQVSVASRIYRPDANRLDFTFLIDPGPSVDIAVEGFKVRKSVLRKRVTFFALPVSFTGSEGAPARVVAIVD